MDNWFTSDKIDNETFIISEYRHWEETHCYLLNGTERSLLIDTGLGICNIYDEVMRLTDKPVTAVATHIHWDHIGGHGYFPDFYAHGEELNWLNGEFPLSAETVRGMVTDRCDLPEGFDVSGYIMFQGTPTRILSDHDIIDIGGRVLLGKGKGISFHRRPGVQGYAVRILSLYRPRRLSFLFGKDIRAACRQGVSRSSFAEYHA